MASGNKDDGSSLNRPARGSVKMAISDGWGRILEGSGLGGRVVSTVLLVVLAVGSGALLGPRGHQAIPYDSGDLGRFAVGTVKAHRNYRIEDREATEHKRTEARETVLGVYDHDADSADRIVRRVRESFGYMQRSWREHLLEVSATVEEGTSRILESEGAAAGAGEGERDSPEDVAASLEVTAQLTPEEVFGEHEDTFLHLLQLPLDDASFAALARARFSPEIEQAVVVLVRHAMSRPIIADRQLIATDTMRGITLRPVPAHDSRNERVIRDVAGEVWDLATARAVLNERLGEVLPEAAPEERAIAGRLARRLVRPTIAYNRDETERRRDEAVTSVRATFIELEAGEKIIGDGERIEARHLVIFQGIRDQAAATSTLNAHVGAALLTLLVTMALLSFARGGVWRFKPSRKDLLFLLTTLLGTLLAVRGGMFLADALADRMPEVSGSMLYFALPAGAGVVLVRLVSSGETTLVFAVALSALVGIVADQSLGYALFTFVGGLVAAERVSKARDRSGIWQAGMLMAIVNVLVVAAIVLQEGREISGVYPALVSAAVAGAVTPVLVLGLAILIENVFRYTTDLKLLELANMNNALLKELVVAAPGTYHHSMMIGSMVESAAEAIGANPLFARVGAYYHDIGKGKSPLYFAENQKGENPHDRLSPSMSALIVRRHVTDGVKMAKAAGLPQPLIDMIPMHHGTRLMVYFFHRAKEEAEKKGEPVPAETDYRYTGPKPRFREAALLMIADSVEAAARTLTEPTTDRLRGLVQKVINAGFADGQFDECNITLKDLHAITRSFVTSLEAIHHSRPEYHQPAEKVSEKAKNGEKEKAKNGEKAGPDASAEQATGSRTGDEGDGKGGRQLAGKSSGSPARTVPSAPAGEQRGETGGEADTGSGPASASEGSAGEQVGADGEDAERSEEGSEIQVEALKRLGTG